MKKEYSPKSGVLLAIIGAVLMAAGYFRGEVSTVLTKAINICLECIGIG
ncbi:MAG: thioredoxin [Clostridia bacterium]|nr:thioredoxin [Clostridia bacterium]